MIKMNNSWLNETKEAGLYFGCYGDKLTVKIGQSLKGIYNRSLQIDRKSMFGFYVQYYIPFTNLWEDEKKNTILALAMEDLVHDWMTQFCNTKDFHKYHSDDHYECSVEGCENFFNYFEKHEKEITNYFSEAEKKLHSIINNFDYSGNKKITIADIVTGVLRIYNNIEEKHGRFIDCLQYTRRQWTIKLARERLQKIS